MKKWSRKHNKCIRCSKTTKKHKGRGLCIGCFDSDRKKTPKSRIVQARTRNKYRKEIRERQRRWYLKVREEMFKVLGNKCVKCGFSDRRALQIDHINGGGIKERGKGSSTKHFHLKVLRSVEKKESKYQLLCANCNWIKRFENREWGGAPRKHK